MKVLLVEDNDVDAEAVLRLLHHTAPDFTIVRTATVSEAHAHLEAEPVDVVLLDLGLPDSQGLDTLEAVRASAPDVPVVVLTGSLEDEENGVEALRRGAQDYLLKDDLDERLLRRVVQYAVERRRAEQRLQRERDLLRQTQRLAGAWELDIESGRTFWSEEVYRIHELPVGTDTHVEQGINFYAPECRSVIQKAVEQAIEEGTPFDVELTIITAKGNRRDVRAVGEAIEKDGSVVKLAGAFQDITPQKEAERKRQQALEEARHERAQLRTIFEQTPSFIAVVLGPDHVFEYTNERYQQLIGHRDVIGKPVREAVPEVVEQGLVELLDHVYASGEPYQAERRDILLQRQPGADLEERYVDFVYQPLRNPDGSVRGILAQGVDVTDRVESEQEADEARRANEMILAHIPDVVCTVDPDQRFVQVNRASETVWGYAPEELEGQPYLDHVHPDDVERTTANVREVLEQRLPEGKVGPFRFENRYVRKDGSVRTMQWSAVWSEADALFFCVARDVTERRQREQRLQLLAASVAEANEAVVITGAALKPPGPRIVFVNEAFTRMTGYSADEVLGETPRILQGPETDRAVLDRLKESLMRGEPYRGETVNYRKDGQPYTVEWSITPVEDEEGTITHYVSVQRDVTEKREAERQQARLAAIVASSDDAILSKTLDGIVTSWNAGAERLYGYTAEEMVGQSVARFIPEDRKDELDRIMASVREGRSVSFQETIRQRKDGSRVSVALTVSPVRDAAGKVIGASAIARDITERKQMEEALQASEERYRRIVETANEGIWQIDAEGRTTYVNAEMADMLGYTVEEMAGMHLFEAMDAEGRARAEELLVDRQQGVRAQHEFTYQRKDGEPLEALVGTAPLLDEDGTYRGALAMVTDITERKQAEEALRRSRERLATAQRIAGLGHWERNLEEETLFWSDETRRIFGWDEDEAVTYETFMEAVHPDDREEARRQQEGALRGEAPIDMEYRVRRPDGTERIVHEQGEATFDAAGTPMQIAGTVLDVTERKRAEQELRASEALKQAVLSSMLAEIAVLDDDGTIVAVNRRWEEFAIQGGDHDLRHTGVGVNYLDVCERSADRGDDLAREALDGIRAALREERQTFVQEYPCHDGKQERRFRMEVTPLGTDVGGVVVAHHDVTDHHKARQQLVAAKRAAEQMNDLKSAFLANMSHEIRTPLTSIIGYAELLREEADGSLDAEFVDMIYRGGHRLQRTLNSVLDLAQLESATLDLSWEPCDVRALVLDTVDLFQQEAARNALDLHADVPDAPVLVQTDQGALTRILNNLVSNALKFTPEGHVRLGLAATESEVTLSVQDTGIGISDDFQDRLFEPFTQESTGLSRDYEGVGIGMTIVQRLVELLGGTLEVSSEKGAGTLFTVAIPRRSSARIPAAHEDDAGRRTTREPVPNSAQALTVLVVEDHEETRHLLKVLLDERHTVIGAATPEAALETASTHTFDLAIIDINLKADLDGTDVLHRLRASPRHTNLPVIACTAYALPGDAERLMANGFDTYLAKPFRKNELYHAVDTAIETRS
ncbi:MAG: PAS domain S-box protein [Bacteroidetes bacterium]|nr:PAS domain S-box protein [Bacteroidota bacterium]